MRILLTAIMLAIFSCTVQAEIAVKVEPSQVHAGESFRLILSQTPQYSGGLPDLTPLQGQFTILGTERSINYSVINGQ
ncbi:MAG: BatD family protein, partial [Legionella sp.]